MTRRRVVTERDVRRAAREQRTSLDVGDAVVTPSARDAARRAGVELRPAAGGTTGPAATGAPAPTGAPPRRHDRPARGGAPHRSAATGRRSAAGAGRAGGGGRAGRAGSPSSGGAPQAAGGTAAAASKPAPAAGKPSVAVGADHGGVALKDAIAARLRELGHAVTDLGTQGTAPVDYPDFAAAVARAVAGRSADVGIMVDGAGIGSCMAANKVAGVRAAMCYDVTTATNAREHNDANLLTLGGGLIGHRLALEIVETFLRTPFAGGRHAPRVAKIDALDGARR